MDSLAQSTLSETIWAIWTLGNCGMSAIFIAGASTTGPTVGRGGKERKGACVTDETAGGANVVGAVVAGATKT